MAFTIGIDYGTNSARAVVVDCADGGIRGVHVFDYPSGEDGVLLDARDPHLARQNPADYLEALKVAVPGALDAADRTASFSRERVIGIGIDTTGSTPLPVDAGNRPLAIDPRWRANVAAHGWLWKDHTAAAEAEAITRTAREHAPYLLAPIGGTYSSEWFWAKIWHCLTVAPDVFEDGARWVELADFVPAVLAGIESPSAIQRCICAAGHKALYADAWGGLPSVEFLARLHPKLAALRERQYERAYPPDRPAGRLAPSWARTFGLRDGIPIAMGGFDAHYGAVGSGVRSGTFVKIIGTSTCDCAVAPIAERVADIPGICGIVRGSIMPGYYGIEAGQSAVGDLLRWWVEVVCQGRESLHAELSREAAALPAGASGLLALDWNNGNRTILVDPRLTGLIVGQTLHTTRAEIYRALVEATAFGARAIIERMREYAVPIERVVCCGGIAEKNPFVMQVYADVTGKSLSLIGSDQGPALGSAIHAAVAAGEFPDVAAASAAMGRVTPDVYTPNAAAVQAYDALYAEYVGLHDHFGRGVNDVMHRLSRIRRDALTADGDEAGVEA